jgi:iron complex transport system ATP-binding protein
LGVDYYVLHLGRAVEFLSSASLGEGFIEARWVLSGQVEAGAVLPDPESCLGERASRLGIPDAEPFVGLLTAVSHQDLQVHALAEPPVTVTTLATVGVDQGSSPRQRQVSSRGDTHRSILEAAPGPGTINIVTLVDADLTPGALVRASTMVTEAKTLALVEAGLKTGQGYLATGTATDVTVVGHTGRGRRFKYAGSATLVGWLVGHGAYHCVRQGLAAYDRRKEQEERSGNG